MCQSQSLSLINFGQQAGLPFRHAMPQSQRPVFHAQIGEELRRVRMAKKWSLRQAQRIAAKRGLAQITFGALQLLEAGKIKSPDRQLLHEVADLYEVPFEDLAEQFARSLYSYTVEGSGAEAVITKVGGGGSIAALAEGLERLARDDDELALLKGWRQLSEDGRHAVQNVMDALVGGAGQQRRRPPQRAARKRSAS